MVKLKLKFISNGESMAGSFKGKFGGIETIAGKALEKSADAFIAGMMIKEGGFVGICAVSCLALLKWALQYTEEGL